MTSRQTSYTRQSKNKIISSQPSVSGCDKKKNRPVTRNRTGKRKTRDTRHDFPIDRHIRFRFVVVHRSRSLLYILPVTRRSAHIKQKFFLVVTPLRSVPHPLAPSVLGGDDKFLLPFLSLISPHTGVFRSTAIDYTCHVEKPLYNACTRSYAHVCV